MILLNYIIAGCSPVEKEKEVIQSQNKVFNQTMYSNLPYSVIIVHGAFLVCPTITFRLRLENQSKAMLNK